MSRGEKFGEIRLPDETLEVFDDGDSDNCVIVTRSDGGEYSYGCDMCRGLEWMRREFGDEALRAMLDGGSDGSGSSYWGGRETRFKCPECNRTWPGSANQTPERETDICPECHDGS